MGGGERRRRRKRGRERQKDEGRRRTEWREEGVEEMMGGKEKEAKGSILVAKIKCWHYVSANHGCVYISYVSHQHFHKTYQHFFSVVEL